MVRAYLEAFREQMLVETHNPSFCIGIWAIISFGKYLLYVLMIRLNMFLLYCQMEANQSGQIYLF